MKISSICKIRSRSIDNGCCSPPPRLLLAANAWSGRGRLVKLPTLAAARCHHALLVAVSWLGHGCLVGSATMTVAPRHLARSPPSCHPARRRGWLVRGHLIRSSMMAAASCRLDGPPTPTVHGRVFAAAVVAAEL